ncbi:MAG: septal ring lytic transglycosylase RlpA family protein [Methyloprofundus sp.]|nr:septal ring lytic transglycosylase RlpA family protein [Methyloprofundus sp.]
MSKIMLRSFVFLIFCLSSSLSMAAEEGIASYYSDVFQGKKTASGEKYDKNKLTSSHKTLPFGTKVKVTDLKNNKSVIVTVNDRGPFSKKRIIDLSRAAAQKIGLIDAGISRVRLDIIK